MESTSISYDLFCLFKILLEEVDISEFFIETVVICMTSQCIKGRKTSFTIAVLVLELFDGFDDGFERKEWIHMKIIEFLEEKSTRKS
jgi:hypothetical protein